MPTASSNDKALKNPMPVVSNSMDRQNSILEELEHQERTPAYDVLLKVGGRRRRKKTKAFLGNG